MSRQKQPNPGNPVKNMPPDAQLRAIEAMVSQFPQSDRDKVKAFYDQLEGVLEIGGYPALMAFTILGAEISANGGRFVSRKQGGGE